MLNERLTVNKKVKDKNLQRSVRLILGSESARATANV